MNKIKKRHKYKKLIYNNKLINIDIEIAKLLSLMWKLGIKTTNSCQEYCSFNCKHIWKKSNKKDGIIHYTHSLTKDCYNSIWIAFESSEDLELFYNYIGIWEKNFPDSSTWQILAVMDNDGIIGCWKGRPLSWHENSCGKNLFKLRPQLTFPKKDLSLIERLLEISIENKLNV